VPTKTHSRDPRTMSAQERLDEASSILARGLVRYLDAAENSKTSADKPIKNTHERALYEWT